MKDKIRVKFLRYKNIVLAEVITLPKKYENNYHRLIADDETDYELTLGPNFELKGNLFFLSAPNDDIAMDNIAFYRYYDEKIAKRAVEVFSRLIHEINQRDEEKDFTVIDMRGMQVTLAD